MRTPRSANQSGGEARLEGGGGRGYKRGRSGGGGGGASFDASGEREKRGAKVWGRFGREKGIREGKKGFFGQIVRKNAEFGRIREGKEGVSGGKTGIWGHS